ncbi:MAG: hypothetical protein HRU36_01915 [Rickettsiales bacterium]|nr:hypothetical protein [Rickettsiales bacterium]
MAFNLFDFIDNLVEDEDDRTEKCFEALKAKNIKICNKQGKEIESWQELGDVDIFKISGNYNAKFCVKALEEEGFITCNKIAPVQSQHIPTLSYSEETPPKIIQDDSDIITKSTADTENIPNVNSQYSWIYSFGAGVGVTIFSVLAYHCLQGKGQFQLPMEGEGFPAGLIGEPGAVENPYG